MNKILHILTTLLMTLCSMQAYAQFYVTGDDPGKAKWSFIETSWYKVIYPNGCDSLARVYARNLEKYRVSISRTSGYLPTGGLTGKKMPAVLHAFNGANGSVAWAPNRMDLFTIPSAYNPEPIPWATELAIHEGRHVTQMQFGLTKVMRPGNYIFGQMWNIAVSVLYPGIAFMEGDAVIAETAYSKSGRGRTADFLNYYRVAFDNNDYRSWHKWRFGSQKHYAPTYYALGYMTIGGFRCLYDCPEYISEAFHDIARRPYNFGKFNSLIKKYSGKNFDRSFMEVCRTLQDMWTTDAMMRAPFIESEQVTEEPKLYADYKGGVCTKNGLYYIKKSHLAAPSVVRIDERGNEEFVSYIGYSSSNLRADSNGNIYWSEDRTDPRWSLKTSSATMFMEEGSGKVREKGVRALHYNPAPSPDGSLVAFVAYRITGKSDLEIRRSTDAPVLSIPAPDTLQIVELAWIEDRIYATAVSENGYGIYSVDVSAAWNKPSEKNWSVVLPPQPVMVKNFKSHNNSLVFTCDRTGVNEIYSFNPLDGRLAQKTCTKYGAEDFTYNEDGTCLYYASQTMKGKLLFRTKTKDLLDRTVDFSDFHKYPIAEKLTKQEKMLAQEREQQYTNDSTIVISEPKRYSKFKNAFTVHSWAPVYVSVDRIMNMSFDYVYQAVSLGASGILQNRQSTAIGEFGYSAHKDPDDKTVWRHSAHAKFTYSGWYPVLEFSVDFNDRAARQYNALDLNDCGKDLYLTAKRLDSPFLQGKVAVYIPFNFSAKGWNRGFIPRLSYTITNDWFNKSRIALSNAPGTGSFDGEHWVFTGAKVGKNIPRQYLSLSLRAYNILNVPNSAVYPKWGIGAEIGINDNLGLEKYISPMLYTYLYGYLPGVVPQQGLKLSVMYQRKLIKDMPNLSSFVKTVPRGFSNDTELIHSIAKQNNNTTLFTLDYGIPIYIGDLAIGGSFLYVKRMVLTPHFDFNLVESRPALFSTGASLTFDLESICFITWPCSIGVTCSYNGGFKKSIWQEMTNENTKRVFVGPVFNVSF